MATPFPLRRSGRSVWPVIFFLLGFVILLVVLGHYWIIPGMAALQDATTDPQQKATLRAYAALLLVVVLTLSIVGLLLVFRVRRFFFPQQPRPHKTEYQDAWSESAKRVEVSLPDDDDRKENEDESA